MNDDMETRIAATEAALLAAARDADMLITGDGRVSEADMAALLCLAPKYLCQMRGEGRGPPAFGVGMNRSRVSYRLRDAAGWIESRCENFNETEVNAS